MSLPLSRAVLSGCLCALQWMLWVTAALLLALFLLAVMHPRGESPLRPIAAAILACLAGGWACGRIARRVESERAD
jgi:hypothetical protein